MRTELTNAAAAELIRERVTVPRLLRAYGIDAGRETGGWRRIPCPLHHGSDRNFSFSDEVYKCWVCGAKGGVIQFARDYRGLSFPDALREIDALCGLGLPFGDRPREEITRAVRRSNLRAHAERLISGIEHRLNTSLTAAVERMAEYDRLDAPEAADAYERMTDAQQALFEWDAFGRDRLREYADFVLDELEADADGKCVFDSQKRSMLETAARNWRTVDDGTGYIPWSFYFSSINFHQNRDSFPV